MQDVSMSYYKEHAKEFIEDTINCDMSEQYRFFEKYLNGKGTILDIGFGSGRDSLYFQSKGYEVYAIDPEEEFVEHGKELGIKNVFLLKVENMKFENMFDGIWACASLLHVPSKNLEDAFKKCAKALKKGGILYASFKYGEFEGLRNGRFYVDLNELSLETYTKDCGLIIVETSITYDVRPDRNEKWINVVFRK